MAWRRTQGMLADPATGIGVIGLMHMPKKTDASVFHGQAKNVAKTIADSQGVCHRDTDLAINGAKWKRLSRRPFGVLTGQRMWAWLPVAAYMALIFYFSSLPHPEEELPKFLFETLGDKFLHLIEYAVLAVLCYRAFRRAAGPFAAGYAVMFAIVTASFYGVTDELHQAFVPVPHRTWLDWMADTAGG